MRVEKLNKILRPLIYICDASSIVQDYRLVQIGPDFAAAKTARAEIKICADFGVSEPFAVVAASLYHIVNSLPDKDELTFTISNGVLEWVSKNSMSNIISAKGRLATQPAKELPPILEMDSPVEITNLEFQRILTQGQLAVGDSALKSLGLYGVVLHREGRDLWAVGSDDVVVSASRGEIGNFAGNRDEITLSPDDTKTLIELLRLGVVKSGIVYIEATEVNPDGTHVIILDWELSQEKATVNAAITIIPPLRHRLWDIVSAYKDGDSIAKIEKERVNMFVKRANALAKDPNDRAKSTDVVLKAAKNKISLTFAHSTSFTEEDYPISLASLPGELSATIDAAKLAQALQYSDEIILDHIERGVVTFRDKAQSFFYIVAKKAESSE